LRRAVAFRVALRLDVDAIKPKRILVDHAVNTIVAAAPERSARINGGAAVAHAEKQVDHKTLEEGGWCRANAIEQILAKRCFNLLVRNAHDFVW
jgi:hypothetical protein